LIAAVERGHPIDDLQSGDSSRLERRQRHRPHGVAIQLAPVSARLLSQPDILRSSGAFNSADGSDNISADQGRIFGLRLVELD
jgi:hypothetical protein